MAEIPGLNNRKTLGPLALMIIRSTFYDQRSQWRVMCSVIVPGSFGELLVNPICQGFSHRKTFSELGRGMMELFDDGYLRSSEHLCL